MNRCATGAPWGRVKRSRLKVQRACLKKLDGHGMLRESYCQNPSTRYARPSTKGGNKDREGELSVEERENEPRGL